MANVARSALVAHSAELMFDLVNDVLAYPKFIPGCAQTKILEKGEEAMRASVQISKAGVVQWFTTQNQMKRGEYIQMELVEGPFTHLTGGWTFTCLAENACKIEFNLDFVFASKLAEVAFGKVFNNIANNMVKAFTDRAKEVYC